MTARLVKYAEALRALHRLVKREGPTFVYESPWDASGKTMDGPCVYVDRDDAPSCGLGKVFARDLEVPVDNLKRADQGSDVVLQLELAGVQLTRRAEELLFGFQGLQDRRLPYAECLRLAILRASALTDDTKPSRNHSIVNEGQ